MNDLQRQARALGDPTRHQVFRYLLAAGRPVDVPELTAHIGLHHNAVRQHLAKLVGAGLVAESTAAPAGRGRPRRRYTIDPAADGRWGTTGPYERLSLLLAEIIRTGDSPVEVGRRAGHRDARTASGPADARTPASGVVDEMARLGFEPVADGRSGHVDIVLTTCPFVSTALADPDTVCGLHLGLALGAAEAVGGLVVDELIRRDPRQANCQLRVHVDA